jgi:hypothetical protein
MAAVPMKPQYGPTLGVLLSPRWRAASPLARRAVILAGVGLLTLALLAVLTLENATFSHGGRVPFSFSYRSLYRVAADPGGYVKVQLRSSAGRLEDSFAVEPLALARYSGSVSGELPVYATGYIAGLSRRYAKFELRGEGKAKLGSGYAYNILYTALVEGRPIYGRDVLVVPERAGAREGAALVMLSAATARPRITAPSEVASQGVLARPFKTFTFG